MCSFSIVYLPVAIFDAILLYVTPKPGVTPPLFVNEHHLGFPATDPSPGISSY